MAAEEMFDVVDEDDRVIGRAPRSDVHAQGLLHRAVHMLVFDTAGRLLVHKRSATKDEFPNVWTSSASGHVDAGEDYHAAAVRELQEELGLSAELEFIEKFPASSETANEHVCLYRAVTDDAPVCDPVEISEARFVSLDELGRWLNDEPDAFAPSFRLLFDWVRARLAAESGGRRGGD